MIISWLTHSIEADIAEGIIHAKIAHQVWVDLYDQFSQKNSPPIFQIQFSSNSLCFLGYPCCHKCYKLYDRQSYKFFISRNLNFCEDDFPFLLASQTLTLALSTPILPLHDSSNSNIYSSHPPPSIPSPDSPTNSNPIPLDTLTPLQRSARTKQTLAWHNDYKMFSATNHLTSSSSSRTGTKYPLHHYFSFSHFSPTQRSFLALITA